MRRAENDVFVAFADHPPMNRQEEESYCELIRALRSLGYVVHQRINLAGLAAAKVNESVKDALKSSGYLIVILNKESGTIGSIVTRAEGHLHMLFLAPEGQRVSRTYLGIVEIGLAKIHRFKPNEYLLHPIVEFLQSFDQHETE